MLGIETGDERHAGMQAGFQLALLGSSLCIAILGGLITGGSGGHQSGVGWVDGSNRSEIITFRSTIIYILQ